METKLLYQQIRDDLFTRPIHTDVGGRTRPFGRAGLLEPPILTEPARADQQQKLTRLHALLDAAVAGRSNLVFIAAEPASDKIPHLGIHGLDLVDLVCLREAVGQALASLRSSYQDSG